MIKPVPPVTLISCHYSFCDWGELADCGADRVIANIPRHGYSGIVTSKGSSDT